jgi:hypothetical protein
MSFPYRILKGNALYHPYGMSGSVLNKIGRAMQWTWEDQDWRLLVQSVPEKKVDFEEGLYPPDYSEIFWATLRALTNGRG